MGKTAKNKRRRLLAEAQSSRPSFPAPSTSASSPDSDDDSGEGRDISFLGGLVTLQELATTVRTLKTLTDNADALLKGTANRQELKALRGAIFDFQRISNDLSGTGTTLTSRISLALTHRRYTDALVLLSELRIRGGPAPKLGALQRWVREVDAASRSDGSFVGDESSLRVLDAILRCCDREMVGGSRIEGEVAGEEGQRRSMGFEEPPVKKMPEWRFRDLSGEDIWSEVSNGTYPRESDKAALAEPFKLIQTIPGPDRLPPNQHPSHLFHTLPATIALSDTPSAIAKRHPVPGVPNAFLLSDLLSLDECRDIVGRTESVGFRPDCPVDEGKVAENAGGEGRSVLAHNLYWLADKPFLETFWSRFAHLLPQTINGGKVTGLNARFRVYRYVPGAIYRPHIDGAWPPSGTNEKGEYVYDTSPKDNSQWSRLTFLIYLNDSFPSGHTTFFLPSPTIGTMQAYPVKPIAGCALVFPHGDTRGSLLHEGSPVGEGGAKYVIRTDVLYEVGGVETGGKRGRENED